MGNKFVTVVLAVALIASLGYNYYLYQHAAEVDREWKGKYEEALIDVEEATTRLEEAKSEVEKALKEAEEHRKIAEEALAKASKRSKYGSLSGDTA